MSKADYPDQFYIAVVRRGAQPPLILCALSHAGMKAKSRQHGFPMTTWQRYARAASPRKAGKKRKE